MLFVDFQCSPVYIKLRFHFNGLVLSTIAINSLLLVACITILLVFAVVITVFALGKVSLTGRVSECSKYYIHTKLH